MLGTVTRKVLKTILSDTARQRILTVERVHLEGGLFDADSIFYRCVGTVVTWGTGSRVHSGPFAGMRYIQHALGVHSSAYCPKLLGTYEQELHPLVEALRTGHPYAHVINIGAGEGYYAIGFARCLPQSRVTAYEADAESRVILGRMAEINGVAPRLTIRESCTPSGLQAAMAQPGKTLIVCDVEGAEQELLDPVAIPALTRADILVELHDFLIPGISGVIRKRFENTHQITEIPALPRQLADWPSSLSLPKVYRRTALSEYRPGGMCWFWMKAAGNAVLAVAHAD